MQSSLALTALLMGLAGGPHCVAMCGAACAGLGQTAGERRLQALTAFQLGRLTGYSLLGALAAVSVQGLGWLTTQSASLRPLWTGLHLTAMALGLLLILQARQPVWLDQSARRLWARVRRWHERRGALMPFLVGALWALMPCGLLYSALMVAALSGAAQRGLDHGLFRVGQQRQSVGWPLAVAANANLGRWCLGHAPGGSGAVGCIRLGAVDGLGARPGPLVHHAGLIQAKSPL